MKIKRIKPRRREHTAEECTRLSIYAPKAFVARVDQFRKELYDFSKQKVTRAYLMREGALTLIRDLRVKIGKAKKGELHAKPRRGKLNNTLLRQR